MIAFFLFLVMFVTFPTMPTIAAVALSGAVYSASRWHVGYDDLIEMIFFYGAVLGCLMVWF